ncbi:unnamed protein product, partial [Strongylus vulgaris]
MILNRNDVAATLDGNELLVTRCKSVAPSNVIHDHNINGTCYVLTPIEIGNEVWFSVPGTDDLVQYSPTMGILANTFSHIQNAGESVGRSLKSIYDKTTTHLSEGVNRIKWSIIYFLLWVTLPVLVIILIVIVCIIYFKLYLVRRTTATAATAMMDFAKTLSTKRSKRQRRNQINTVLVEEQNTSEEPLFVPRIYSVTSYKDSKHHKLPYIRIHIENQPFTALIDSGASISYMKLSTLQSLGPLPPETFEHDFTVARAANGTEVQLLATVTPLLRIGKYFMKHPFQVSPDEQCPAPVLLGSDFIRRLNEIGFKITIDLHNQSLTIGDENYNL